MPFRRLSRLRDGNTTKPKNGMPSATGRTCRGSLVYGKAGAREAFDNRPFPAPQLALVVPEQQEVVYVAQVCWAAQLVLHEVIERAQIAVGPELAGKVADGKPARPGRGEEVVAPEIDHIILFAQDAHAAGQDLSCERQQVGIPQPSSEHLRQYRMVDARKRSHNWIPPSTTHVKRN